MLSPAEDSKGSYSVVVSYGRFSGPVGRPKEQQQQQVVEIQNAWLFLSGCELFVFVSFRLCVSIDIRFSREWDG